MNYGKKATMQLLRKYDNKSSKVKNKFKLIVLKILLVVVIVAGAAGISSGIGVMKGIIDSAPDISKIDVTPTGYSTTVLAANGEETATLVGQGANRQYVTIDEIPLDLQHAFVAIEDERFYDHNGIDLHGIGRAFISCLSKGRFSEGASTITQQLIKNNVLTSWTSETSGFLSSVIEFCSQKSATSFRYVFTLRSDIPVDAARAFDVTRSLLCSASFSIINSPFSESINQSSPDYT